MTKQCGDTQRGEDGPYRQHKRNGRRHNASESDQHEGQGKDHGYHDHALKVFFVYLIELLQDRYPTGHGYLVTGGTLLGGVDGVQDSLYFVFRVVEVSRNGHLGKDDVTALREHGRIVGVVVALRGLDLGQGPQLLDETVYRGLKLGVVGVQGWVAKH